MTIRGTGDARRLVILRGTTWSETREAVRVVGLLAPQFGDQAIFPWLVRSRSGLLILNDDALGMP